MRQRQGGRDKVAKDSDIGRNDGSSWVGRISNYDDAKDRRIPHGLWIRTVSVEPMNQRRSKTKDNSRGLHRIEEGKGEVQDTVKT